MDCSQIDADYETTELVIEDRPVTVEKVHFVGLSRTKQDYVAGDIKGLFKAKSFLEVYKNSLDSKVNLMNKGVFQDVEVTIDTTEAYDSKKCDGVQVLFKVREKKNIVGELRTEMSNMDKPNWVMRIMSPNVLGRGESISFSLSHALTSGRIYTPDDFNLTFSKPVFNCGCFPEKRFNFSILQSKHDCVWNALSQRARGISAGCDFDFHKNRHHVELLGQWRELSALNSSTPVEVRKESGHSMKTSILHSFVIDHMDIPILPKAGKYLKLSEEVGVYSSKTGFWKEQMEAKICTTLAKKFTFELGTHAGFIIPFGNTTDVNICDKFFIGGPLSLRGFEYNSVGPCANNSYLGTYAYWLLGGHMYTPLPFFWNDKDLAPWKKNMRLHAFINAGNCKGLNHVRRSGINSVFQGGRLSCGMGLVYNFMQAARFELNFCLPIMWQKYDKTTTGLQFGIGVSSL